VCDLLYDGLDAAFLSLAQGGFELGEDLLNRVEVGRVRRQKDEPGADAINRRPDRLAL
jgi:hypothetical protein